MKGLCAIISGGICSTLNQIGNSEFIIACDKGYHYAKQNNIIPNLIIGDLDSYNGEIPSNIQIIKYPKEKDDTDTMAAIRYAVSNKYEHIDLYCALGGRMDHILGNIQAAAYAIKHNIKVKIIDENNIIYLISNSKILIPKKYGFAISVLSFTNTCENVSIQGAKYELNNATITNIFPIGISNEWINDIQVSVGNGILIIILSKFN